MNIRKLAKPGAYVFVVLAGTCAVVFAILAAPHGRGDPDVSAYLPEKAQIGSIRPGARKSVEQTATKEAVLGHDLDNDGIDELTVFYTLHRDDYGVDSAHVVVLKRTDDRYEKLLEHEREGAPYINPLSSVWDINGDGKLEIVAARWVGASFGGYLDIFQWNGTAFVSLNGQWNDRNDIRAVKLDDIDKDGIVEITILHRFSSPDTYKWQQGKYVLSERGEPYPAYR
ncbi:MAG: FG-GAP repeat domain-containing protein [Planctomycetota bacterium]